MTGISMSPWTSSRKASGCWRRLGWPSCAR